MNSNTRSGIGRIFTPVNTVIVLANVIVCLVLEIKGDTTDARFMIEHGGMYWPYIKYMHEYHRLFTSAFLHFGIRHLISNMIVLLFIGDNLERALGHIKYTILYVGVIFGTGLVCYGVDLYTRNNVVSAGASGAILGVVGAMLYILIRNKGRMEDLRSGNVILFIIFSLYQGFRTAGTDNVAHISGLAIGFLLGVILYRKNKRPKKNSNTFTGSNPFEQGGSSHNYFEV